MDADAMTQANPVQKRQSSMGSSCRQSPHRHTASVRSPRRDMPTNRKGTTLAQCVQHSGPSVGRCCSGEHVTFAYRRGRLRCGAAVTDVSVMTLTDFTLHCPLVRNRLSGNLKRTHVLALFPVAAAAGAAILALTAALRAAARRLSAAGAAVRSLFLGGGLCYEERKHSADDGFRCHGLDGKALRLLEGQEQSDLQMIGTGKKG